MTDTKGNGIMNAVFDGYGPYKGDLQYRSQGSLIAFESGEAVAYGLFNAQDRGTLFIKPGEKVVLVDDLIATGGTIEAAAKLIESLGGIVVKMVFLIELTDLKGRERLSKYDVASVVQFEGE